MKRISEPCLSFTVFPDSDCEWNLVYIEDGESKSRILSNDDMTNLIEQYNCLKSLLEKITPKEEEI